MKPLASENYFQQQFSLPIFLYLLQVHHFNKNSTNYLTATTLLEVVTYFVKNPMKCTAFFFTFPSYIISVGTEFAIQSVTAYIFCPQTF